MAVSFDLFGTLVSVDRTEPTRAIANELRARDVTVPDDWERTYGERHVDAPEGAEVPLPSHVAAALRSRGVEFDAHVVRRAVVAAFDPAVETRAGAHETVSTAAEYVPVALLSNCSVPELVPRVLIRSDLDRDAFDAVVTSVGCGWRKPHPEAFHSVAEALDCAVDNLVHVGDSEHADGGIEACGGRFLSVDEHTLAELPDLLSREVP
ncbi:HAD family hydrolase [Natronorarus salvus]|uniref:HAD family hydrolase n=1 Tax=Natronorarus salvus TaxID=3117733 RepID=UPI002F26C7CD